MMSANKSNSFNTSFEKGQSENKKKLDALKSFILNSYYINFDEQANISKQFGLPYFKKVFSDIYKKRFFDYLKTNTTTVANIRKVLGIPEKILCQWKKEFEQKGLLKVVCFDRCPAEGSANVGFISTNTDLINGLIDYKPSNQLDLFNQE